MKTLEIESWEDFKKLLDKNGVDLEVSDEESEGEDMPRHHLPPIIAKMMKMLQGEENEGEWNELMGSKPLGFSITIIKKMPLKGKGEEEKSPKMKIEKQDEEARKPIVSEDDEVEVEDEE